jgi:hypothetical protein
MGYRNNRNFAGARPIEHEEWKSMNRAAAYVSSDDSSGKGKVEDSLYSIFKFTEKCRAEFRLLRIVIGYSGLEFL